MPVRHARLPNLVATTFIDCISRLVSDWKLIRDARLRRGRWRRRPAASAAAARADDKRRKCATQSRRHQSRRRRRPSFRRGNFICNLLRFFCGTPDRAVLTNGHTGHVPRARGFFFLFEGPQLAVVK